MALWARLSLCWNDTSSSVRLHIPLFNYSNIYSCQLRDSYLLFTLIHPFRCAASQPVVFHLFEISSYLNAASDISLLTSANAEVS